MLLPDDRASHPISKGELSHPAEEAHFGRLHPRSVGLLTIITKQLAGLNIMQSFAKIAQQNPKINHTGAVVGDGLT